LRLLYTPIAGYVHTVEAVINYAGLRGRVEPVATKPFEADTPLPAVNPVGKVPTLVLEDGEALFGGPVIYEYLDTLHDRAPLHPREGRHRFTVLRQAWMADALFDQFVQLVVEGWLYADRIRADHVRRTWGKVTGILDRMDAEAGGHFELDIGQVRAVGALSFIDLKMAQVAGQLPGLDPAYDWREGRRGLAAWYAGLSCDPIFGEPLRAPRAG
jgi:glutathione S-transferase